MLAISDKELYHLTISINKALNPVEAPLKIKHVRSAIITTHHTREAKSLWSVITRQPLMENRFTAWKFCHFLHKVLREGHETTIKHSQTHKKMILEMGKLWRHLNDGVGNCIQAYSTLLVTKLDFHDKNRIFPGSLIIDFRDFEKFAGDDINDYFQLCVEIFDYLDDIIEVQLRVFASVKTYRMSSMTPQGQCRLAPLITLIQDSNPLYDLCVRNMFKLHDKLPNDILSGHRNRFLEMFVKLKLFYDNVRPLQYFADLIQVPHLPETAPNFTSKVDLGSYIPPVVYVPEPEPVMDNLVDTSFGQEQQVQITNPPIPSNEVIALENKIRDLDFTIKELQNELTARRMASTTMEENYKSEIDHLSNNIQFLSNELTANRSMCTNLKSLKDELEKKVAETPIILLKATEEEERAKALEEKFSKLKAMYTQMRDEHITLLRQNGETSKILQKENAELKLNNELLQSQVMKFEHELELKEVTVAENYQLLEKLEILSQKYETFKVENDKLKQNHEEVLSQKCADSEIFTLKVQELLNQVEDLEQHKNKVLVLETSLNRINEILRQEQETNRSAINSYKLELEKQTDDIINLKKTQNDTLKAKDTKIFNLQNQISETENNLRKTEVIVSKLADENSLLENQLFVIRKQFSSLEKRYKESLKEANSIAFAKKESEEKYENLIAILVKNILNTCSQNISTKCNEGDQQFFDKINKLIEDIESFSEALKTEYAGYFTNKDNVKNLLYKAIMISHCYTMIHEQCSFIYNTTTAIETGEGLYNQVNSLGDPVIKLYKLVYSKGNEKNIEECIQTIKTNLAQIKILINNLVKAFDKNVDLGDLVENELEEMSKVINDAASRFVAMLSNAKSRDNGIKLEVNEKILDACTALMECIKQLIKRSRILQDEIVSSGKRNTSAKEFYKRNSQWSEGLISASKNVAKGAKLLVEAANKAVNSESNRNFEIIVAAQEIAACTAQLVIASKVKAPRESQKLVDLTKASRNVSQATGVIIATVKNCNQNLEQLQDVDLSKLTSSQAKTMEMDIHVKVLELEQALQSERLKLSAFRRNNYQNTEE